jgi:hypothetical protein
LAKQKTAIEPKVAKLEHGYAIVASTVLVSDCLKTSAAYDARQSAWRGEENKTRQPTDAALG